MTDYLDDHGRKCSNEGADQDASVTSHSGNDDNAEEHQAQQAFHEEPAPRHQPPGWNPTSEALFSIRHIMNRSKTCDLPSCDAHYGMESRLRHAVFR